MRFFSTFYFKLALVLLVLLGAVGGGWLVLSVRTANSYLQEVQQSLNREVAHSIVKHNELFRDGEVNEEGIQGLFMKLMAVNPTLEVYLLDPEGRILQYDAPPERVVRQRVDLAPVREFLRTGDGSIVLGEDPRSLERRKIFSAAPVLPAGPSAQDDTAAPSAQDDAAAPLGYVYAVLASEEYDSVVRLLRGSYILRGSLWVVAGVLGLVAFVGLIAFRLLTQPLRELSTAMETFESEDPGVRIAVRSRDEIGELGRSFNDMADRITEQVQTVRKADRLRREMVENISHDLRTPLASLQGYLETCLLKEETLAPEQRRDYLETALRNTERLNRLVEDLFQLARFDAGEVALQMESFSLAELVQDVTHKFQPKAAQRGIELAVRSPQDLPAVTADLGLIERVLDNLVDNALSYTQPGGKVSVSLTEQARAVEVRVADTGAGIPKEDLPRIFDRFYRVEKSRGQQSGGTGLGLAITKRILDLHRSVIQVRSRPDVGTVFSFLLAA